MTKLQPHRSRFELKAIFALLLAIVVTGAVAVASSAGNTGSPRSGELHVTKNCSHYTGAAGSFCTITSSNLNAIKAEAVKTGMKYLQEDGLRQVIEGKTSIQELLRVCK